MANLRQKNCGNSDFVILPELNDKSLKKLGYMSRIKCWKSICVSDNLRNNEKFREFAIENNLRIMDGKWLFKNMVDQIAEYAIKSKNEVWANQEIGLLCNKLDGTVFEKIKEISLKSKICNILTDNLRQFKKIEEEIFKEQGIVLNVSNNYKKTISKANLVINFDFDKEEIAKCVFNKNADFINISSEIDINKNDFQGRNIIFFEIYVPEKYFEYLRKMEGFNKTILYESFIYKNTSYKNIKKEIIEDELIVESLQEFDGKMIKNDAGNFAKTLDKITI